jgi:desulfoferrodoxin-like iron-binding protein
MRGEEKEVRVMPAVNDVYICERCGLEVEVRKAGHCIPQCCGQEMRLKT